MVRNGWKGDACARIGKQLRLCPGRTRAIPRQRIDHSRMVYVFPEDFPQRLKRFQQESGLSWAEIARRLETSAFNLSRWKVPFGSGAWCNSNSRQKPQKQT